MDLILCKNDCPLVVLDFYFTLRVLLDSSLYLGGGRSAPSGVLTGSAII